MNKQLVYSPTQAAVGSFLGGPLSSLVFIKGNFRALGNGEAEGKTLFFGTSILLLLIGLLPFLPERFPGMAIPIATVVATRMIIEKYQFSKQAIADSVSLEFHSNWRVLWISLLCCVAYFAVAVAFLLGMDHFGIVELS